jgi:hypothetical protein
VGREVASLKENLIRKIGERVTALRPFRRALAFTTRLGALAIIGIPSIGHVPDTRGRETDVLPVVAPIIRIVQPNNPGKTDLPLSPTYQSRQIGGIPEEDLAKPPPDRVELTRLANQGREGYFDEGNLTAYGRESIFEQVLFKRFGEHFYTSSQEKRNPMNPDVKLTQKQRKLIAEKKVVAIDPYTYSPQYAARMGLLVTKAREEKQQPSEIIEIVSQDGELRKLANDTIGHIVELKVSLPNTEKEKSEPYSTEALIVDTWSARESCSTHFSQEVSPTPGSEIGDFFVADVHPDMLAPVGYRIEKGRWIGSNGERVRAPKAEIEKSEAQS